MPPHERAHTLPLPARMARVAVVAPKERLRDVLVAVADAGVVELSGPLPAASGEPVEALRRLQHRARNGSVRPVVSPRTPDLAELERAGDADLLAGEVELSRREAAAVARGSFAALVGWVPATELDRLATQLEPLGAAALELETPSWLEPPTLLAQRRRTRPFRPLVETYGASRYADLDPTPFAAFSFVLMFGMMFGDVGHGLLVVAAALWLRATRSARVASVRSVWPLMCGAGLSAALFGLLYGECFGPTGLVPTLWLDPLDEPTTLLAAALVIGALLLAQSYAIGSVNRWRERGPGEALLAPSGLAGTLVFLGGAVAAGGLYLGSNALAYVGAVPAAAGLLLLVGGHVLHAGRGPLAAVQAGIESIDSVVRIGASAISFTRLAAFGLVHAALGAIVWSAATAAWGGVVGSLLAILVFVVGNAVAFTLELLVAGVQALRLEYYELFSRIFAGEGRAFAPWRIPVAVQKEES
ncbi:MAG TPA: V-type ATPase 116kDa subunit family protein [Gaiellaceae bacterium]|nr:V-type ATPase 116kDa subunit family protein [Gaiellaceae bacterium]